MEGSGWENYQWKVLRGKISSVTKVKTPHCFSFSLRCRLLEGFSFGFVFWFSLRSRLLEGCGS